MTIDQFLETEVLTSAEAFFGEGQDEVSLRERGPSELVSSVPARLIRGALAVVALGVFPLRADAVAASTARFNISGAEQSGAAVEVPSLNSAQARAARFAQAAFEAVDPGEDADGEDPDYGL